MRKADEVMNISIYSEILGELVQSANNFDGVTKDDVLEVEDDFSEILEMIDITGHQSNIDGVIKSTSQLLIELKEANAASDKQRCLEAIVMLRVSMMSIESAFSNAADSMEKLVVSIRDA